MKKTYISPEMLTVQLGTVHMMAESLFIDSRGTNTISSSSDILVKETTPSDVNLWDNEW
jgi:hypothetical protein